MMAYRGFKSYLVILPTDETSFAEQKDTNAGVDVELFLLSTGEAGRLGSNCGI
jgi:hypothetical protein